jgi:hypothetical protein
MPKSVSLNRTNTKSSAAFIPLTILNRNTITFLSINIEFERSRSYESLYRTELKVKFSLYILLKCIGEWSYSATHSSPW